jgi:cyclopropane fatty-acyl-phospholipid synthase-like methyltransferase
LNKPFSQACVNNREPITAVLKRLLAEGQRVLEIGSGTGQHAVWIGQQIPTVTWQTSDRCENHSAIQQWVAESNLTNVYPPIALDVAIDPWPNSQFDMIFSSNTAHIMAWQDVEKMFQLVSNGLNTGGYFCLYGPMQYDGIIEHASNRAFNQKLKSDCPHRAIRDVNELNQLATNGNMQWVEDNAMPANNRLLVWLKS